jgi:hypothetical protein
MINVFFHGASVTQQDGVNSYFYHIKNLAQNDSSISFQKKAMVVAI